MIFLFLLPAFILYCIKNAIWPSTKKSIKGKHVVITGGSSGIGKSVAILAAKQSANVTIIARNVAKLAEAAAEIKANTLNDQQIITNLSVDVSDYKAVAESLKQIEATVGPIYMLVNCAGMALCGKVEDFSVENVKTLIDVNYLGTLYPIQALLPSFKARKEGIIVITASQVALMGMYGYSIYASCKFALRGLAESLRMETEAFGISVTLALPPDTDTPGFEIENESKPIETKLMSESGGLQKPENVAKKLLTDALNGQFFSYVGFESFILTTLCVGMSPVSSFFGLILEASILGPLRLIGAYYVKSFDGIVRKCHNEKQKEKQN